jgi:cystinosin
LDFTGGLLSNLQLIFDCLDLKDFTGITGNLAKFCLGSVSIFFDIIFMLQHYVFFTELAELADERQPLLCNEDDPQQDEEAEPCIEVNP